MTPEHTPSTDVVETVVVENHSRAHAVGLRVGAAALATCTAALGIYGAGRFMNRESQPCEINWARDMHADRSPTATGAVTLPDGKKISMSVSTYLDQEVPKVQISLGGPADHNKQVAVIKNNEGPEATFELNDGNIFFVDATTSEVKTWCATDQAAKAKN